MTEKQKYRMPSVASPPELRALLQDHGLVVVFATSSTPASKGTKEFLEALAVVTNSSVFVVKVDVGDADRVAAFRAAEDGFPGMTLDFSPALLFFVKGQLRETKVGRFSCSDILFEVWRWFRKVYVAEPPVLHVPSADVPAIVGRRPLVFVMILDGTTEETHGALVRDLHLLQCVVKGITLVMVRDFNDVPAGKVLVYERGFLKNVVNGSGIGGGGVEYQTSALLHLVRDHFECVYEA